LGERQLVGVSGEKVGAALFTANGGKSNLLVKAGDGEPGWLKGRRRQRSLEKACLLAEGVGDGVSGQREFS
ncbi:hypothetical protein BUE65_21325, partial [Klebsiella variicola]